MDIKVSLRLVLSVSLLLASRVAHAQGVPTSRQIPFVNVPTTLAPGTPGQVLTLRLLNDATPPNALYCETQTLDVNPTGAVSFNLGAGAAATPPCPSVPPGLNPGDFASGSSRFLDIVDGTGASVLPAPPGPLPLAAVAFALSPASGPMVRTVNGLVGDITLAPGPNVTITPSGSTLTIEASTGLATVSRDVTLTGNGTSGSPLGVAAPLLLTSLGQAVPTIRGTNTSFGIAVEGVGTFGPGVSGFSTAGNAVDAQSQSGNGVEGRTSGGATVAGVKGMATGAGPGVWGESTRAGGFGVFGLAHFGVWGETRSSTDGAVGALGFARSGAGRIFGVWGETPSAGGGSAGVLGVATATSGATNGVWGQSNSPAGVGGTFINLGGGDAINAQNNLRQVVFRVTNTGTTVTRVLEIQGGADLSERFDVETGGHAHGDTPRGDIEPGMVVSVNPTQPGKLVVSRVAYDRRAVGVISGAGGVQPGMLMGQSGSVADGAQPVALAGRVYCWADATKGSIEPGDLLTTSTTPGHAMKAAGGRRAQGAIIGKALTGLREGKGLVLILVTLR